MIITNETAFVMAAHQAEARSLVTRVRGLFAAKPAARPLGGDLYPMGAAFPRTIATQELPGGMRLDVADTSAPTFASTRRVA